MFLGIINKEPKRGEVQISIWEDQNKIERGFLVSKTPLAVGQSNMYRTHDLCPDQSERNQI